MSHGRLRTIELVCLALCLLAGRPALGGSITSGTFDSKGGKIAYTARGKGEPVILIHGWLASGRLNWDLPGISDLLAKDHQVITVDMPGHGLSDKPTKDEAYGPELVEDVVRLMDHLKIKKAHLVGYSMGGIIAANLTVNHPDRVLSVVLGGMGWLCEGGLEQKFFAGSRDRQPYGVCFRSLAKLALTEKQIKSIHVPVLVLIGDHDGLKKPYVEPLKTLRKDWPVVEIKDANHLTCVGKQQFKEEIQKWLAKQGGKAPDKRR
jgi:pimeloyl-ACP methyl ester carboxylesterase